MAGGRRGDEPERQTTSAGHLGNSGDKNMSHKNDNTVQGTALPLDLKGGGGNEINKLKSKDCNRQSPCSAMPHREPSTSAGKLQTLCGNRTVCLGSHSICTALDKDKCKLA